MISKLRNIVNYHNRTQVNIMKRKTENDKTYKIHIMLVLSIVTILHFAMLVVGDENGQEYVFYTAVKEGAVQYADLGIITPEPISNIANSEKQVGNKTEYLFNIPESLYKVKIRNVTIANEEITIETLKNVSNLTTSIPAGNVYVNENIWMSNDTDVYIDLKIKNSWLETMDNVQLLKWTGDRWKKLGLREIGKDGTYTYFEEGVAGSSILSIVGNNKRPVNGSENQKSFLRSLPMGTEVVVFLGVMLVSYIVVEEAKKTKK
jgi:PGF-pre-PGF domain-containing protein